MGIGPKWGEAQTPQAAESTTGWEKKKNVVRVGKTKTSWKLWVVFICKQIFKI